MTQLATITFDSVTQALDSLQGATAKQARDRLEALAVEVRSTECPDACIPALAEQIGDALEALSGVSGKQKNGLDELLQPLRDWVEENYPQDTEVAGNRISEAEQQIEALMRSAATSFVRIGGILLEVKEEFDATGTGAFFTWAEERFGFKKAYAYRLMQVYREFGNDPALSQVRPNVLSHLFGVDSEKLKQARELAEQGKLDTKTAKQLAKGEETAEEPAQAAQAPEGATVQGEYESREEAAPWTAEDYTPPEAPDTADQSSAQVISELRGVIEDLREQLRQTEQARARGTRQQAELPSLPQFKSSSYAARLGLSSEEAQDAGAVREAFRGLVKAGYGESHKDFPAIEEARAALQEAIEKAA